MTPVEAAALVSLIVALTLVALVVVGFQRAGVPTKAVTPEPAPAALPAPPPPAWLAKPLDLTPEPLTWSGLVQARERIARHDPARAMLLAVWDPVEPPEPDPAPEPPKGGFSKPPPPKGPGGASGPGWGEVLNAAVDACDEETVEVFEAGSLDPVAIISTGAMSPGETLILSSEQHVQYLEAVRLHAWASDLLVGLEQRRARGQWDADLEEQRQGLIERRDMLARNIERLSLEWTVGPPRLESLPRIEPDPVGWPRTAEIDPWRPSDYDG